MHPNEHAQPAVPSPTPQEGGGTVWLVLSLAWAGVIFTFSTSVFSAEHTGSALRWILDALGVHLGPHRFDLLHFIIRKLAHLSEYTVLALLLGAWLRRRPWWRRVPGAPVLVVMLAGCYALTDEFHQVFVHGRTASLRDCALDTAGAAVGLLCYTLLRTAVRAYRSLAG